MTAHAVHTTVLVVLAVHAFHTGVLVEWQKMIYPDTDIQPASGRDTCLTTFQNQTTDPTETL